MKQILANSGTPPADTMAVGRYIFAGLCASLVSIGLARFAYTPLIPFLIEAHWFGASDVLFLGAANLAGYLIGAVMGPTLTRWISRVSLLRLMMLAVSASFLACAFPVSVHWFFAWRLVSGVAGGTIMVLLAGTILPHVPPSRKGRASGAIFVGLGIGVVASGTIVPLFLAWGLREAWIGLAMVALLLTCASWFAWPAHGVSEPAGLPSSVGRVSPAKSSVKLLYVQYALMAIALVPAMIFLVDFVARGLMAGAQIGAAFWILYGVGALIGPPAYGFLADRLDGQRAAAGVLTLQLFAVLGLATFHNLVALGAVTLVVGSFPTGIVPLTLTRIHEIIPQHGPSQNSAWSLATTAFAACQAIAAYAFSAIFSISGGNHRLLFLLSSAPLVIAILIAAGPRILGKGVYSTTTTL
ncbi:MFS transporter [Paraburkholderia sp. CNPSo 3272]|uniref:YbfB/YjiJ family MFS transporter n=1 Tax=Paraburkholderia sp. CNPSo 3272 TaxID=2940931 RepID=UPI0020B6DCF9|nr:YbfB/YjiJ family MFS transporter [Paraburkholderia sp. CNPSo 3272]MCP3728090.1 MFS transporter [Paraburkholderia sp. CNPSo 3272]